MTLAFWCVLAAALLPYVCTAVAKSSSRYDNRTPRRYLESLDGWRQRAHWAQLNSFEAFPPFAAAVLIAQMAHAPQSMVNTLALVFVVLRMAYVLCYITDKATLRSIMWLAALGCVVGLFGVAALA